MTMDIYAQPNPVAPIVWMQEANFDPKRRKLGASGIHTTLVGERPSGQQGGSTSSKLRFTSHPTLKSRDGKQWIEARTSGVSLTDFDKYEPTLQATGDSAHKLKSLGRAFLDAPPDDEIARISDQRVRLLAARYEQSNTSAEVLARLAILDRRLTEKVPRVSVAQLEVLEKNLDTLASLRRSSEVIAGKLAEISKR